MSSAWLSPTVLGRLDLAVTIALAVLGVLVGIALGREMRSAPRLFLAASLESVVTIAFVAGATIYFVDARPGCRSARRSPRFALALGLCASASSATSADPDSEPAAEVATRVADLDDVLPIVRGDGRRSVCWRPCRSQNTLDAGARAGRSSASPSARSGGSLFERAESGAERVVFVLGALALAGGAAAYCACRRLASD